MKNKIAWFTLGLTVLLCIAATTPIDRLRLTSDADGGNHGITNVNTLSVSGGTSNFIGGITVITNLAQTISTNFIDGFAYTNFGPRNILVSYEGNAAVGANAGANAGASLSIDPAGGLTFATSISHGGETTTALSIARTIHFTLFGVIVVGQSYVFTNQCTGGNTMNFISGSGRLTQF